ncbi:hypothetical protein OAJ50_05055 [Candidatus Nitrosopelagicus sp.]|nr:hypothetical protein [Candidatus Nitrosopelagicus sp.]
MTHKKGNRHLKSSVPMLEKAKKYVNKVANEEYKAIVKKGNSL